MHPRAKKKQAEKDIAKQHVNHLFSQADDVFATDQALAHRYVTLAREIQMRFKIRMPRPLKRKYCKHCYHYIRSGTNGRVRIRQGVLTMYCDHCKKYTRTPFKND